MKLSHMPILFVLALVAWNISHYTTRAQTAAGQLEFSGRLEAVESVDLRPRVAGVLAKVNFQPGQQVKAGDVLFEIDARIYQIVLERTEAELRIAEARLKIDEAQAEILRALGSKGTVSRDEVQKAQLRAVESKDLLAVAKANLMRAQLDMEFTKIRSPIDGTIGMPSITLGNVVRENDTILANISSQSMRAIFQMDIKTFLSLQQASLAKKTPLNQVAVTVTVDGREIAANAKVEFFDNRLDPETKTVRVGVRIANPNPMLLPGTPVQITLQPGKK